MSKFKFLTVKFWINAVLDFVEKFRTKKDFVSIRVKTPEGYIEVGGPRTMVYRTWLDFCRHSDEFLRQPDDVEFVEDIITALRRKGVEDGFIKEFEAMLEWEEILENYDEEK